jgi:ribosomal protein S18 acetylase RimI-like enzyme
LTDLPVEVRAAAPVDAARIALVHVESWRAWYRGLVPQPILDRLSVERRATFWTDRLAEPGETRTWVASRENRIVGFAGTALPSDPAMPPGTAELEMIYLLPDMAGRGVGRRLMALAVGDLVERGFELAILWVFTANDRARRFYERGGWQPDGSAQDLDFDGTPIEEVRYRMDLLTGVAPSDDEA